MTDVTVKRRKQSLGHLPVTFSKRLDVLKTRGVQLREAGQQWAQMFVEFCRDYTSVYHQARDLDSTTDAPSAAAALDALFEGVSEPTKSQWRTVGAADTASTLLSPDVLKRLPPSTESIYRLATLPRKTLVTIEITPDTTVRMVRLETARLSLQKKQTAPALTMLTAHTSAVSVKFDFDTVKRDATIATLAMTLHQLLTANPNISLRIADSHDRDEIKAAMGEKHWKSIAERLGS